MAEIERFEDDNKFHPEMPLDDELQRELDEALGGMSVEDILDADRVAEDQAAPAGEGVRRGTVMDIQGDDIFVELGGKSQGILPAAQFEDEPLPQVGETVEVTIERYDDRDGLLILSRKGAVMAATWETIEEGQVVEGRVTGHNKGGLELTISGIRAFMPISQIELFRVEELAPYVNQRLRCEVTELDRRNENVVVSRRSLLEAEAAELREKTFRELEEGQIIPGVVKSVLPYGAFVDIGGVDGLLHVRDMSYSHTEDPRHIVQEGMQLKVKVLSIDRQERKIALGLKQILPDPWAGAEEKWPVETVTAGRITRLADFGAFVELEEGVEGLIPISELSFERRVKHPGEVVSAGDVVKVRVLNVDTRQKRIGLSLKRAGDDPWMGASVRWPEGAITDGVVKRITDFGAFVELSPGVEGLVHISELSDSHVRSVSDVLREGQVTQVKVLNVDEDARRISLSVKQLAYSPDYTGPEPAETKAQPKKRRKRPLKGGLD